MNQSQNMKRLRCIACSWTGCDVFEFHTHLTGHSESGSYYFHGPTLTGHPDLPLNFMDPYSQRKNMAPTDSFLQYGANNTNNSSSMGIVKTEPHYDDDNTVDDEPSDTERKESVPDVKETKFKEANPQDHAPTTDMNQKKNDDDDDQSSFGVFDETSTPTSEKRGRFETIQARNLNYLKSFLKNDKIKLSKPTTSGDIDSLQSGPIEKKPRHENTPTRIRNSNEVVSCHLCLLIARQQLMYNHIETVHDGDYRWKCTSCLLPFLTQQAYDKHMNWCKSTWCKSHACMYCYNERLFLSREKLVAHINTHHNQTFPLQCNVCKEPLASKFDEECHMSKHDEKLLKCRFCNVGCKSVVHREQHTMKHILNDYTCYICEGEYSDDYHCWNHTLRHLDNSGEYVCEKCGLSFGSMPMLTKHKRKCEKKFFCQLCGRNFAEKKHLEAHMSAFHAKEKPFVCDQCGAAFSFRGTLNKHVQNRHTSERLYVCKICSKDFKDTATYSRHLMIHENKLPFKCEYCDKLFRTKWNLQTHIRQHTGEKPYMCTKCGMCFTHNVARKGHEANCTGMVRS